MLSRSLSSLGGGADSGAALEMEMTLIEERVKKLETIKLESGAHISRSQGMCIMEAAS